LSPTDEGNFKAHLLLSGITVKAINAKEVTSELLSQYLSALPSNFVFLRNPKAGDNDDFDDSDDIVPPLPDILLLPVAPNPLLPPVVEVLPPSAAIVSKKRKATVVASIDGVALDLVIDAAVAAPLKRILPVAGLVELPNLPINLSRKRNISDEVSSGAKRQCSNIRPVLQIGARVKFCPTRRHSSIPTWINVVNAYGTIETAHGRKWSVRWNLDGEENVVLVHESLDLYALHDA
jgi:hypothetical protein